MYAQLSGRMGHVHTWVDFVFGTVSECVVHRCVNVCLVQSLNVCGVYAVFSLWAHIVTHTL